MSRFEIVRSYWIDEECVGEDESDPFEPFDGDEWYESFGSEWGKWYSDIFHEVRDRINITLMWDVASGTSWLVHKDGRMAFGWIDERGIVIEFGLQRIHSGDKLPGDLKNEREINFFPEDYDNLDECLRAFRDKFDQVSSPGAYRDALYEGEKATKAIQESTPCKRRDAPAGKILQVTSPPFPYDSKWLIGGIYAE